MSEVNLNKKVMLNTKDMSAGSGRTKPVLDPGNHVVKINSITLDQTPVTLKVSLKTIMINHKVDMKVKLVE